MIDSVTEENQAMADKIKLGALVRAIDLNGAGVITRKSGKIVDTQRSKRADKIRACFSLSPNAIAEKGDRMLYIQVINPKNNLLGENEVLEFENGTLNYSASTKVFYENEELDVCSMVAANENDLVEGVYTINIFDGSDPVLISKRWLEEAEKTELNDANAMALASVDHAGMPNVRMVLLKEIDETGFIFYTNYNSVKATEIFPNCPRYVPDLQSNKPSKFLPDKSGYGAKPDWKNQKEYRNYLPKNDPHNS